MNVLLVYKRSFLERHRDEPRVLARLTAEERRQMRRADREMRLTLRHLHDELARRGCRVDAVYRGLSSPRKGYELVVTAGGDGTFFLASHFVGATPILGVNSDPERSLGLHCGATRRDFAAVLDRFLLGAVEVTELNRFSIELNGRRLASLGINDALFAHRNPASMARYVLEVDGRREEQRSSGVWIATAAGSTAGIRGAGGRRMPLLSRRIQYAVREPYSWPRRPRLRRGESRREIAVRCLVEAAIWIDGAGTRVDLGFGDRAVIRTNATLLRVINLDETRWRRIFP